MIHNHSYIISVGEEEQPFIIFCKNIEMLVRIMLVKLNKTVTCDRRALKFLYRNKIK